MEYHFRKHPRLQNYDYAQNGAYFITICTRRKQKILCDICVGRDVLIPPNVALTRYGKITHEYIQGLPNHYHNLHLDKYVIMPNHIHLLISMQNSKKNDGASSIVTIVRSLKTFITRRIRENNWQDSFYEHIVRNNEDYLRIWSYIDNNPAMWLEDEYYC